MSRNTPWNEHCFSLGSTLIKYGAPGESLKSITFSVLRLFSCNILVIVSSTTLPNRISLQCGSEILVLSMSVRPVV